MDSIHLSVPFGFNAIMGIGMLLLLKIFHMYFNRDIKDRWDIILIVHTLCYYISLACVLPACYPVSFLATVINSAVYNYFLLAGVFGGDKMIYSLNIRIEYR